MREPPARDDRAVGLGLAAASSVILAYEVTQLRIFAYAMSPVLVYSAIGITMLGFGVGATAVALSAGLRRLPLRPALAAACLVLSLTGLVAMFAFARFSPQIGLGPSRGWPFAAAALAVVLACTLPYACGGLVVALVLAHRAAAAGRFYFLNLLGSGLGCFAVSFLLRPLGAERMVFALMALAALAAALLAGRAAPRLRAAALGFALVLGAGTSRADRMLRFSPDPTDQLALMAAAYRRAGAGEPVREHAAWDPVARIEVHSWPGQVARVPAPVRFKILTQDGGAASLLLAVGDDAERGARVFGSTAYGVAFGLRPRGDVLVIGTGGAPDVQAALYHGARHVTAVEINESTVKAATERFADFLGRPLERPEVEVVLADGRSLVSRPSRRYDVIQISGADTLTPPSSGSFVLAEEYLYTEEAFADYLRALRPDGIVSLLRFAHEPYRLAALAASALRRLGILQPERHVVVLSQALLRVTLVKRSPWTAAELGALDRTVAASAAANRGMTLLATDVFDVRLGAPLGYLYAPHRPGADPGYAALRHALGARRGPERVLPTDDRPYYFAAEWVSYFRGRARPGAVATQLDRYVAFMAVVVAVALGAIVLPAALRRRSGPARRRFAAAVYFSALGLCYALIEIALMQKATIAVEHPANSVAVVLAALLLSSSVGSLATDRWRLAGRATVLWAAVAIAVLGGAYALGLDALLRALMPVPFGLRLLAVAALVAALGAPMGVLLPTGLRALGQDDDGGAAAGLVPWAIAANGFASVVGSALALPVAVLFGFAALLATAAGLYVVGCLTFLWLAPARPR